jgi:DNA end-binding protein Ku
MPAGIRSGAMPRSIWNGVISFGMVSIPVKLYNATESKDVSFHQLHQVCGSRLKQLRWCPNCDREVEWGEIDRGYEYAKEQHVVLTEEDMSKLPLPSKRSIDLSAFVRAEEIDPVYYDKSYYLEPEDTGKKPYALLMRALKDKELTAVATIAIRNKERLCALRPYDGTMILETLLYPDEIRVQKGTDLPNVKISASELKMAFSLIDLMAHTFKPEEYKDRYREAVMEVIEAKLTGAEIVQAPAAPKGKVVDLMDALKASVAAAKDRKQTPAKVKSISSAKSAKAKAATRRRKAS